MQNPDPLTQALSYLTEHTKRLQAENELLRELIKQEKGARLLASRIVLAEEERDKEIILAETLGINPSNSLKTVEAKARKILKEYHENFNRKSAECSKGGNP